MPAISVQIQSILFNNEPEAILRAVRAIDKATAALNRGREVAVTVFYGDCSPEKPCLSDDDVQQLRDALPQGTLKYEYFAANLGSAQGHNRLAEGLSEGYVLIQNPDVIGESTYLLRLLSEFDDPRCGMAEARQLPIEHPKEYDPVTGETCWATTACALIPVPLFNRLEGFDSKTFFLYCDDVDFSWRVRLAGLRVIYQPAAVVFHDKRLKSDASWNPSSAEQYYSIEAALLMAHKYSRPQRVKDVLAWCDKFTSGVFFDAAKRFRTLEAEGQLPDQIDPAHTVSQFIGDNYAEHRFSL